MEYNKYSKYFMIIFLLIFFINESNEAKPNKIKENSYLKKNKYKIIGKFKPKACSVPLTQVCFSSLHEGMGNINKHEDNVLLKEKDTVHTVKEQDSSIKDMNSDICAIHNNHYGTIESEICKIDINLDNHDISYHPNQPDYEPNSSLKKCDFGLESFKSLEKSEILENFEFLDQDIEKQSSIMKITSENADVDFFDSFITFLHNYPVDSTSKILENDIFTKKEKDIDQKVKNSNKIMNIPMKNNNLMVKNIANSPPTFSSFLENPIKKFSLLSHANHSVKMEFFIFITEERFHNLTIIDTKNQNSEFTRSKKIEIFREICNNLEFKSEEQLINLLNSGEHNSFFLLFYKVKSAIMEAVQKNTVEKTDLGLKLVYKNSDVDYFINILESFRNSEFLKILLPEYIVYQKNDFIKKIHFCSSYKIQNLENALFFEFMLYFLSLILENKICFKFCNDDKTFLVQYIYLKRNIRIFILKYSKNFWNQNFYIIYVKINSLEYKRNMEIIQDMLGFVFYNEFNAREIFKYRNQTRYYCLEYLNSRYEFQNR